MSADDDTAPSCGQMRATFNNATNKDDCGSSYIFNYIHCIQYTALRFKIDPHNYC